MKWISRLQRYRRSLADSRMQLRSRHRQLATAAPYLLDSRYRDELILALESVNSAEAEASAELSYAKGVLASQKGDQIAATKWLTRAHALGNEGDRALSSRIGLELGVIYLATGERVAADAILAQLEARADSTGPSADQLLLRGLLYRDIGDHRSAQPLFRAALAGSGDALTPQTQVLALVNLAVAVEHADPSEAVALCRLARAVIEREALDPRWRPRIWNIEGYAQLCRGNLAQARVSLTAAIREAHSLAVRVHELRARFNLAIVDELEGEVQRADAGLSELENVESDEPAEQLRTWAAIRRAWIALGRSDLVPAYRLLEVPGRKARCYWEALDTLHMRLAATEGDFDLAEKLLRELVTGYREREDHLIAMVLLLWRAHIEVISGSRVHARGFLAEAWEIGTRHGFLVAPSWWAGEIVETAKALSVGTPMWTWAVSLVSPGPHGDRRPRSVAISRDGDVVIAGATFDRERWRRGGTGSRVLQRYLALLAVAYPGRVSRDRLADTLWPESDGDRAVNNLYAATSDLRRVLRGVDGVTLVCDPRGYGLRLHPNARVMAASDTEDKNEIRSPRDDPASVNVREAN